MHKNSTLQIQFLTLIIKKTKTKQFYSEFPFIKVSITFLVIHFKQVLQARQTLSFTNPIKLVMTQPFLCPVPDCLFLLWFLIIPSFVFKSLALITI